MQNKLLTLWCIHGVFTLAVSETGTVSGRMGCMILRRTFHIAPEQGQGRMAYIPIFQVLKLFQVGVF